MPRKKTDRNTFAWWLYILLIVSLTLYGLWNSEAAEMLLRALTDAFSLIITP